MTNDLSKTNVVIVLFNKAIALKQHIWWQELTGSEVKKKIISR